MISVMFCLSAAHALACTFIGTHNYYLFRTFERGKMEKTVANTDTFWKTYVGSRDASFSYLDNLDEITAKAKQKKDQEVLNYIQLLNSYLKAADIGFDSWDYPTKEQLAFRTMTITNTLSKAQAYNGTRLRPQYQLLVMRANMQLKRYKENISYWKSTGSKLPASAYRTWMRSLYANALCNTGAPTAAADIYTELGDEASVTWCVRKYRNFAGIRSIYEKSPNASVLNYLVQDFVNNTQETIDDMQESYKNATRANTTADDVEWIKMVGGEPVFLNEARMFIAFANQVAQEGKTEDPCMWKSAAGTLHYLLGDYKEAAEELAEAIQLRGSDLAKDNARAISVVVEASTSSNSEHLVYGMQWLARMAKSDEHYNRVLDRLLYNTLAPRFANSGDTNRQLAALAMASEMENNQIEHFSHIPERPTSEDSWSWNPDYSGEYIAALDSMSADQLISYVKYLNGKPANALDRFMQDNVYRNADYFNDRIGTRYLDEGQFSKAIPYLKKVPLSFLEIQNISYRLAHQDYTLERWFCHKTCEDKDGAYGAAPTSNQKLAYCQWVLGLQKIVNKKGRSEEGKRAAYDLATAYYQASWWGDCWHLTRYGHSVYDEREKGEFDFVGEAIRLLEIAATSNDNDLRGKSLYALAFIPLEPWCDVEWTWNEQTNSGYDKIILHPTARQYRALNLLNDFSTRQRSSIDSFVSKCDVLKTFRREKR